MTGVNDRRLQRVEAALFPTEAMALWLQGAKEEHRTLNELVASLRTQPDEAWPLVRLTHQAEVGAKARLKGYASVFAGLKGQRAQFLERGGRDAVRDAATLWFLFVGANSKLMAEQRAMALLVALLNALVGIWVHQDCPARDDPLDGRIASCLSEIYGWQATIGVLAERYFEGVNPLMPEIGERLANMVREGELLAASFNDALMTETAARKAARRRSPALPTPIDPEAIRRSVEAAADSHASLLVDMARAEAHEMMGERKQALAFAERHFV
jgi:hypothetical protein